MDKVFQDQATLTLFLLFFLPGFLSLKVYDLLVPGERRDFSKSLFDAIAYSALNFAVLLPLIWQITAPGEMSWPRYLFAVVVFVVAPIFWPVSFLYLRRRPWFSSRIVTPHPRAWDALFVQREPYWVIVHLKDGRRVGGVYAANSFASSSPAGPELYLEETWDLDAAGNFMSPVPQSAGVLILGDEVVALELFVYP